MIGVAEERLKLKRSTAAAMLVTLTCLVQVLSPPGSALKLVGFPVILSGFLLGPGYGAMVGAVSDILGYLLYPAGPFFPGFTLTQALTGAIPAAVLGHRRVHQLGSRALPWLVLAIGLGQLVTSVLMVSGFLTLLYGLPFWAQATYRGISQLVHVPIYAWLAWKVLDSLEADPRVAAELTRLRPRLE
ncbi:MAG: folate family ECF transporter S component [Candidatus Eremiobacteraeota bacterium]|nr:folate family ECF transporter S component [Candidatus Eremiobacteraeota bacterium]